MKTATRNVIAAVALAITGLAAQPARAALVPYDSSFGPGTIIYDNVTGLSWLRSVVSAGTNYTTLQGNLAFLGSGTPRLNGFTIASKYQFDSLLADSGLSACGASTTPGCIAVVRKFLDLFANTRVTTLGAAYGVIDCAGCAQYANGESWATIVQYTAAAPASVFVDTQLGPLSLTTVKWYPLVSQCWVGTPVHKTHC